MEMIKQSRIKKYFSDIVGAIGLLISVFGLLSNNDYIWAFGMGLLCGSIAGIVHNIWTISLHIRELRNIASEMKKAVESE